MISQKQILIVEDNEINRMLLGEILSADYQVVEAENGLEALSVLKERGDVISLILLDITMPVMDGYTFLSIVKKDPVFSSIPVIVTTQSDSESDEVAALSHGASDFVAKPYKPQIILHRVASIINLRENAAMVNQLKYDRLTGLYSKEFFFQKVKEELARHPERNYDIICSDIENFKLVNDVFGLPAGDRLLREVADFYQSQVGDKGICGHFNGDQFAILMERRCKYTDEIFMEATARVNALPNAKNVLVKWGIYSIEDRTIPVDQMCDRALLAACGIKGQYGKYFAIYDDRLRSRLLREQAITECMESALKEGQFEIYLQPKYSVKQERLSGAESLIRWNHPEWGLQSPGQFIPLFEQNGFITRLDQYVWDQTCAILQRWEKMGYPEIPVSVNVSRADIYNVDLPEILTETVQKYGLPPSRLHLEITESAYTENPSQIIEVAGRLRELGFIIEMDDFGSGYSSLNMLNKMPIDILKLDMKFIQNETEKQASQGILRFTMGLARWMDLSVVAEGVETREQFEQLREIGCDYVQGYYFAKPMPCGEFETLIKEQPEEAAMESSMEEAALYGKQRPVLLVADEDEAYCRQVRRIFESRYQIVEASDGEKALACIASYENKIGAAIISLTLSEPDGFQILEMLQRERAVWNIPVIATSWDGSQEEKALDMEADEFLRKPHTAAVLEKRAMRAMRSASSRERERMLEDEACQDFLTGLLNRRGLDAAANALDGKDMPLAVYLFDLDNLKLINDTYGHVRGDQTITAFANLLRVQTRESDILSRLGGDEFVVIMKQMKSGESAVRKGEDICRSISEYPFDDKVLACCSAGVVIWDTRKPLSSILECADQALYRAKAEKKGGCCLWEDGHERL